MSPKSLGFAFCRFSIGKAIWISPGWWLTYPSEKYEFVNGKDYKLSHILWKIKNVPNHQPVMYEQFQSFSHLPFLDQLKYTSDSNLHWNWIILEISFIYFINPKCSMVLEYLYTNIYPNKITQSCWGKYTSTMEHILCSVVWNICYFPIYWECHHPNGRTPSFFRGIGQLPTSHKYPIFQLISHQGILHSPTSHDHEMIIYPII